MGNFVGEALGGSTCLYDLYAPSLINIWGGFPTQMAHIVADAQQINKFELFHHYTDRILNLGPPQTSPVRLHTNRVPTHSHKYCREIGGADQCPATD